MNEQITGKRFPYSFKVGALTYKVTATLLKPIVDGKECGGSINFDSCAVMIAGDHILSAGRQHQVFWHEVVHALVRDRGLDFGDNDELFVTELAKALSAFCVDNGVIFSLKPHEFAVGVQE